MALYHMHPLHGLYTPAYFHFLFLQRIFGRCIMSRYTHMTRESICI